MSDLEADFNQLDQLAESFVGRLRRGERATLAQYIELHPDLADRIREFFPALAALERVGNVLAPNEASLDGGAPLRRCGEYRILRQIGRGGMGIVYEAVQESLGRHVALKVLPAHAMLDPKLVQRFEREAKAAARLHHTNIVPVYGVGAADGLRYYVMQFIQGQPLDQVLRELQRLRSQGSTTDPVNTATVAAQALLTGSYVAPNDKGSTSEIPNGPTPRPGEPSMSGRSSDSSSSVRLPGQSSPSTSGHDYWRSVARIGIQVADALAYAHSQGTLHRDIKPSNLILDTQATVWITDFGLAKAADSADLTHSGDLVGTLRYMAPERFGGQADIRGDIYALGLTLYELTTLQPAFTASDKHELMQQVMHEEPPRPRKLTPDLPRDLETIILKSIARDPRQRYQTPAKMAEDLRRYLEDRPIQARRASNFERAWRWARRNPVVAGLSAAVALLLIAFTIGTLIKNRELDGALQASDEARLGAIQAGEATKRQRWEAIFEQAKANRLSRRSGQRFKTLELLRQCADEFRTLELPEERRRELRNAVIATLAMPDMYFQACGELASGERADFDGDLQCYALLDVQGNCTIRRVSDGLETGRIPGTSKGCKPRLSSSGQFLALLGMDGVATLWKQTNAEWVKHHTVKDVFGVAFKSDDRWMIVTHIDGSISVLELPAATVRYRIAPDTIRQEIQADMHPSAPLVVTSSYFSGVMQVRDLSSGKVIADAVLDRPCSPVWHPEGRHIVVTEGEKRKIHRFEWDARTRTLTNKLTFPAGVDGHYLAFNRTGDRLAVNGWASAVGIVDFATGEFVYKFPGGWNECRAQFDAAGQRLGGAHKSSDQKYMNVGFWHVGDAREYRTIRDDTMFVGQHLGPPAVSPDGRILAAGINQVGVAVWDLTSGRKLDVLAPPKGGYVVFDGLGTLYSNSPQGVFRLPQIPLSSSESVHFGPPEIVPLPGGYNPLRVSSDGTIRIKTYGATYGEGPALGIWIHFADRPGLPLRLERAEGAGNGDISSDGRWLAYCHGGVVNRIRIWEVKPDRSLQNLHTLDVSGTCRFSQDGRWLLVEGDRNRLFRVGTWEPGPSFEGGNAGFSPDGRLLATSIPTGQILLHDTETGKELARLEEPSLDISYGLTFTPDGGRLIAVTGHTSHGIHIWDLRRIRRVLKEMNLDWEAPEFTPEPQVRPVASAKFIKPELAELPAGSTHRMLMPIEAALIGLWADPWASAPRLQLALHLYNNARFAEARAHYSLAILKTREPGFAYASRGHSSNRLGQWAQAAADYDIALKFNPEYWGTRVDRAWVNQKLGKHAEVIDDMTIVLKDSARRKDPWFWEIRAASHAALGHAAEAEADRKAARDNLTPADANNLNANARRMVTGLTGTRDPDHAEALARHATDLAPQSAACWNSLGICQYRLGRFKDAIASFQQCLIRDQVEEDGATFFFLAMCHARAEDRNAAEAYHAQGLRWLARQKTISAAVAEMQLFRDEAEAVLKEVQFGKK